MTHSLMRLSLGLCVCSFATHSAFGQTNAKALKIVRLEHEGYRTSVAFSPDGKTLATGGGGNHICLWNVATGQLRRAMPARSGPAGISRIAYFPNGRMLASTGWALDGTVKLWEVATGGQRLEIGKNSGGVAVLAVSPDGKILAWGDGGKVRFYEVWAGRDGHTVTNRDAVDSIAFSPDGKLLAAGHGDGKVRLWEVTTGKSRREILAGQSTATGSQAVAFSPDGKILATASRQARLWKVDTGDEIAALGPIGDPPFCVAISPDGRLLVSGGMSGPLRLWDMKSHKLIHSWNEVAVSVAFSPDSKWLAFGDRQHGGACLIDLAAADR